MGILASYCVTGAAFGASASWIYLSMQSQKNPKQPRHWRETAAWALGSQRKELLTQCEIFQDEILTRTNGADHPSDGVPQQREHGGDHTVQACYTMPR